MQPESRDNLISCFTLLFQAPNTSDRNFLCSRDSIRATLTGELGLTVEQIVDRLTSTGPSMVEIETRWKIAWMSAVMPYMEILIQHKLLSERACSWRDRLMIRSLEKFGFNCSPPRNQPTDKQLSWVDQRYAIMKPYDDEIRRKVDKADSDGVRNGTHDLTHSTTGKEEVWYPPETHKPYTLLSMLKRWFGKEAAAAPDPNQKDMFE